MQGVAILRKGSIANPFRQTPLAGTVHGPRLPAPLAGSAVVAVALLEKLDPGSRAPEESRWRTGPSPRRPSSSGGSASCPRRRPGGPSSRSCRACRSVRSGVYLSHEINGLGRPTPSNPGIDFKRVFSPLSNLDHPRKNPPAATGGPENAIHGGEPWTAYL